MYAFVFAFLRGEVLEQADHERLLRGSVLPDLSPEGRAELITAE